MSPDAILFNYFCTIQNKENVGTGVSILRYRVGLISLLIGRLDVTVKNVKLKDYL
jgi:hypothetical protein